MGADPYTAAAMLAIQAGGMIAEFHATKQANDAQAAAERRNALFYEEQADFAAHSTQRELTIFEHNSDAFMGDQVSKFAQSGISLSSRTARMVIAQDKHRIQQEKQAIIDNGEMKERLARLRAQSSYQRAGDIEGTTRMQQASVLLRGAGNMAGAFDFSGSPSDGVDLGNGPTKTLRASHSRGMNA